MPKALDAYKVLKKLASSNHASVYLVKHMLNSQEVFSAVRDEEDQKRSQVASERSFDSSKNWSSECRKSGRFIQNREQILRCFWTSGMCDNQATWSSILRKTERRWAPLPEKDFVWICWCRLYLACAKFTQTASCTETSSCATCFTFLTDWWAQKIKISDFGISRQFDTPEDLVNTSIGTPYYMAPEIFKGIPYTTKTDVWSLGCLFYEALTGRKPFEGKFLHVGSSGSCACGVEQGEPARWYQSIALRKRIDLQNAFKGPNFAAFNQRSASDTRNRSDSKLTRKKTILTLTQQNTNERSGFWLLILTTLRPATSPNCQSPNRKPSIWT